MKIVATLLIVLGLAALIPAGVIAYRDMARTRGFDGKIAELANERTDVREELREVNLEYRGYQQSIPTMPDSTRKQQSGQIMATYRDYNKRVRLLENQERELTRLILRQEKMKSERNGRITWWAGGLGGGGAALLVLGVVMGRRARG